jgi:hypothetical protein
MLNIQLDRTILTNFLHEYLPASMFARAFASLIYTNAFASLLYTQAHFFLSLILATLQGLGGNTKYLAC